MKRRVITILEYQSGTDPGNKQGTGQALVTIALADHVRQRRGDAFMLIQTSPGNQSGLPCIAAEAGTMLSIDARPDSAGSALTAAITAGSEPLIIITGGSADLTHRRQPGADRYRVADTTQIEFTTLLVIADRQRLPLELLARPDADWDRLWLIGRHRPDNPAFGHVAHPGHHRSPTEPTHTGYLPFPTPPPWAARAMLFEHRSPAQLVATTSLFDRIAIEQWRNRCAELFLPILGRPRASRASIAMTAAS